VCLSVIVGVVFLEPEDRVNHLTLGVRRRSHIREDVSDRPEERAS
jgi:hypothetical protein